MNQIKSKFDKRLNKYHIEYHKIKNKGQFRYDILKKINKNFDIAVHIETNLGSENSPDQLKYARDMESLFAKYALAYQVRPIEVAKQKDVFAMFSLGGKKTETHYAITFMIPKSNLNPEMFEDLLCEFDIQIGYDLLKDQEVFFGDMMKGYIKDIFDSGYFENCFYDSRIFSKFLATEDLTQLSE